MQLKASATPFPKATPLLPSTIGFECGIGGVNSYHEQCYHVTAAAAWKCHFCNKEAGRLRAPSWCHSFDIVLIISWTLYYYVVIITFHKSKKCVHATKVVFDGSDIVLSQLVTCSREIEFIRVECTQTMTKTCMYACMGKFFCK